MDPLSRIIDANLNRAREALRVAEDIATADVISGGRIDPGFGQGYAPHEFAGYGIPLSERLSRFVEGLDVVQGLWSQDTFSYEGRHYHIDSARLVPKPVQDPMPLWIGATTVPAVKRAGRRGANLLGTGAALLPAYEEALGEGGFRMQDAKVLQFHFGHIAGSEDDAWDQSGARFHHLMSVYQDFANASGGQGGPASHSCLASCHGSLTQSHVSYGSCAAVARRRTRSARCRRGLRPCPP